MNSGAYRRDWLSSDYTLIAAFAFIKLLIHLATNIWGGYGYFRDELYYLACANHLDFGYVDQPPFSIYMLALNRWLIGDSIFAIRLMPALLGAATVFLTGLIARDLGGKRFAISIACTGMLASLIALAGCAFYSMNAFEMFFWVLSAYFVLHLIKSGRGIYWIFLGIVVGIGMLNKIGITWLAAGIFFGTLFTSERRWFKTPYPYIGGVIALLFFLPFIIWNILHDYAHVEFIRNATTQKYSSQSPLTFLTGQILQQNPLSFPLWLGGLAFYFFHREGKRFRIFGWMYSIPLIILIANGHSKPEYLAPGYSMLFAGGGILAERLFSRRAVGWIKPAYAILIVAGGCILTPAVLPILPVDTYIRYADILGIKPDTAEGKELSRLPQFYADMFGWEEKADAVAKAYLSLTPEEQQHCGLYFTNYGRCGAIDFFGKKFGLPPSIGSHNNYWLWGPGKYDGKILITLTNDIGNKRELFRQVDYVGFVSDKYCMPYENNLTIYVCRGLKLPLAVAWPRIKHYE